MSAYLSIITLANPVSKKNNNHISSHVMKVFKALNNHISSHVMKVFKALTVNDNAAPQSMANADNEITSDIFHMHTSVLVTGSVKKYY